MSSLEKLVYGRPLGRIGRSETRHRKESARHAYSHCVGVCERGSPAGRQASLELGSENEQVIFKISLSSGPFTNLFSVSNE